MTIPTTTHPYHLAAGEGPALWHLGGLVTFKATSENTANQMWIQEVLGERGYATPLHRHTREDEAFYILDGEMSVYVGDNVLRAGPGSFLWAPRNLPHAYCVESDQARFLALSTPGGFDHFFFATGQPAETLTVPAPPAGPPDIDSLIAALAQHGVDLVGPPPQPRH